MWQEDEKARKRRKRARDRAHEVINKVVVEISPMTSNLALDSRGGIHPKPESGWLARPGPAASSQGRLGWK